MRSGMVPSEKSNTVARCWGSRHPVLDSRLAWRRGVATDSQGWAPAPSDWSPPPANENRPVVATDYRAKIADRDGGI